MSGTSWLPLLEGLGGPVLSGIFWASATRELSGRWKGITLRGGWLADFRSYWSFTAAGMLPLSLLLRTGWAYFAGDAASLAIVLAWYWWRKRKDRIKAALGAKSKALRDALVRKARESARPSPVLRPSLGGAR